MSRLQRGYIYEASGFFFVRYCTTATFYKKVTTDGALRAGMKALADTHGK